MYYDEVIFISPMLTRSALAIGLKAVGWTVNSGSKLTATSWWLAGGKKGAGRRFSCNLAKSILAKNACLFNSSAS